MAIKIIRHGDLNNLNHTIEFTCKVCGCVFEADKGYYNYQYIQRENVGWFEIKFPFCDKLVAKSVECETRI